MTAAGEYYDSSAAADSTDPLTRFVYNTENDVVIESHGFKVFGQQVGGTPAESESFNLPYWKDVSEAVFVVQAAECNPYSRCVSSRSFSSSSMAVIVRGEMCRVRQQLCERRDAPPNPNPIPNLSPKPNPNPTPTPYLTLPQRITARHFFCTYT